MERYTKAGAPRLMVSEFAPTETIWQRSGRGGGLTASWFLNSHRLKRAGVDEFDAFAEAASWFLNSHRLKHNHIIRANPGHIRLMVSEFAPTETLEFAAKLHCN